MDKDPIAAIKTNTTQNSFDKLPNEILFKILRFFSSKQDQFNSFNVCQRWRKLITEIPILQQQFDCKYWYTIHGVPLTFYLY